ncbi:G protein-activated inward rectifier potassium channel 4 [Armadillidium nasatum]|uniref:G protein-activated inward rectifier potassium channel 4 n=1 Tax=Armadillidium nasatum TaxID=96803 RepID=A0A5N5T099_9CRUS|nr:G protein-activated inward rectifier potassium channel 4 [Armadillidium nasatum]
MMEPIEEISQECGSKDIGDRRAIIRRSGDINIIMTNLNKRRSRYLQDIYTTLVDMRWRWTLLVFFMAFMICWLAFGFIYYIILKIHGDDIEQTDPDYQPCLMNVRSFTGAFLYSIETQHTIGYGYRYTTEECPQAIIVMCLQSIVGIMIQAFMVGVVFAKLTRPKKRSNTILFSRIATISLRNSKLCLIFRVADMRKSFIIGATVKAELVRKFETLEGEVIPYYQSELKIATEGGSDSLFFMWPLNIVHVIDDKSPFYNMSAIDIMNQDFELVVYLEGTAESTGTSMQARCSYLPANILWGHRFINIIDYSYQTENYEVDFSRFNTTEEIPTPLCSAKNLEEYNSQSNNQLICYSPDSADEMVCLEPELFTEAFEKYNRYEKSS